MPEPQTLERDFFKNCGRLESLVVLDLEGCEFTPSDLTFLPLSLRELSVAGPGIDGRTLAFLCQLPTVEKLSVRGASIADDHLVRIQGSNSLRELDLSGTRIGNNGLIELAACANLKKIIIRDTAITEEGIAAYREAGGRAEISDGAIQGGRI